MGNVKGGGADCGRPACVWFRQLCPALRGWGEGSEPGGKPLWGFSTYSDLLFCLSTFGSLARAKRHIVLPHGEEEAEKPASF